MVVCGKWGMHVTVAGTRRRRVLGAVVWGLWISVERAVCGSGWGAVGSRGNGAVC